MTISVPRLTTPRLLAAVAVSSLALAACGSSSKATDPPTSPATISTGVATTTAAPAVPTLGATLFAKAPGKASKPDDVTLLDGLIYVSYQNNAGKDGTPAGSMSTIASFDVATHQLKSTWSVLGRCDGLTADPTNHRLLASVNEDANSSLFVITPGNPMPVHYTYSPDPEQKGSDGSNGGTDAISVAPNGTIFVAHSNPDPHLPAPNNTAAVYTMTLKGATAKLTPFYGVNDPASVINAAAGSPASAPLALSDPDSNRFVANLDGGTLIQVAQGDSKVVFSTTKAGGRLRQLNLTNAASTGVAKDVTPQIDDITQIPGPGTLYVVDQGTYNVLTINMTAADAGKYIVSQPNPAAGDLGNIPALSLLDTKTGVVTQVDATFGSPKGLLFISH